MLIKSWLFQIGGASEAKVGEKKDRVTDALNATKAAAYVYMVHEHNFFLSRKSTVCYETRLN